MQKFDFVEITYQLKIFINQEIFLPVDDNYNRKYSVENVQEVGAEDTVDAERLIRFKGVDIHNDIVEDNERK